MVGESIWDNFNVPSLIIIGTVVATFLIMLLIYNMISKRWSWKSDDSYKVMLKDKDEKELFSIKKNRVLLETAFKLYSDTDSDEPDRIPAHWQFSP